MFVEKKKQPQQQQHGDTGRRGCEAFVTIEPRTTTRFCYFRLSSSPYGILNLRTRSSYKNPTRTFQIARSSYGIPNTFFPTSFNNALVRNARGRQGGHGERMWRLWTEDGVRSRTNPSFEIGSVRQLVYDGREARNENGKKKKCFKKRAIILKPLPSPPSSQLAYMYTHTRAVDVAVIRTCNAQSRPNNGRAYTYLSVFQTPCDDRRARSFSPTIVLV